MRHPVEHFAENAMHITTRNVNSFDPRRHQSRNAKQHQRNPHTGEEARTCTTWLYLNLTFGLLLILAYIDNGAFVSR